MARCDVLRPGASTDWTPRASGFVPARAWIGEASMNDSFEDQAELEIVTEGLDCESGRGAENISFQAAVAVAARCELFEGGLGI